MRLRDAIPPDFKLIAEDGILDLTYQGMGKRRIHVNFWDETSTEQENISLIVSSVLNNVQDAIVRAIGEIWPVGQEANDLPDTSWEGQIFGLVTNAIPL